MATVFELSPHGSRAAAVLLSAALRGPTDDPPPCQAVLDMLRCVDGGFDRCERDFRYLGPLVVTRRTGGDVRQCCSRVLCCALDFCKHLHYAHSFDGHEAAEAAFLILRGEVAVLEGRPFLKNYQRLSIQLHLDLDDT